MVFRRPAKIWIECAHCGFEFKQKWQVRIGDMQTFTCPVCGSCVYKLREDTWIGKRWFKLSKRLKLRKKL